MDRLVLCPAPLILPWLGLIRDHDDLVWCDPGHSLDRPVGDAAIRCPRERVAGARASDLPAGRCEPAEPERRGDLGYDCDPVSSHGNAAVVLKQHRFWQPDLTDAVPVAAAALECVDPAASGDAALRAAFAPVALA